MGDDLMSAGAAAIGATPIVSADAAPSPAPTEAVESTSPVTEPPVAASPDSESVDADDLDSDDEDYSALPANDPQVQRVLKRLRKLDRWAKKHRPVVQRVRDLDVDSLIVTQRNHQALMERLQAEPELLQRVVTPGPAAAPQPQAQAPRRPEYQPLAIPDPPFEPSDEGGKYIHEMHRTLQALHKELWETRYGVGAAFQDLLQWRKGLEGERQQSQVKATVSKWTAAIEQVGQDYDDDGRQLVADEIKTLYQWAKANNRQDILNDPAPAIARVLEGKKAYARFKKGAAPAQAAAIAQAASQQRIAEQNRQRPGAAAFTGGTPAPARNKSGERIKDVIARKLGRHVPA